jgi:hypothetical protein
MGVTEAGNGPGVLASSATQTRSDLCPPIRPGTDSITACMALVPVAGQIWVHAFLEAAAVLATASPQGAHWLRRNSAATMQWRSPAAPNTGMAQSGCVAADSVHRARAPLRKPTLHDPPVLRYHHGFEL